MSEFYELARKTDFQDTKSVENAMSRMRDFSDEDLDRQILWKVYDSKTRCIQKAIALAELERERRTARAAEKLAFTTTKLAGWMGIVGSLIGAAAGAALALLLQI
ncbi:conserved hypothetical protein [Roseibium sp. TrichSKD4]|uniref:hypothetical protein n=1 Tax=Roseibium sp. TrichSKD4 TaxID=744980 RepID=UPI0001E5733F|nr:hypothetical protein [Roseibium sp. TrichSKD4]EFO29151.1 conserved hypothetical protein [Roseibium sp. TrichSKD4]